MSRLGSLPSALDEGAVRPRIEGRQLAVFLDYDGTLTPIVDRPEHALLPEASRRALAALAEVVPVGIISGRDLDDVRRMVHVDGLWYAGSHGFDVLAPDGSPRRSEEGSAALPALDRAEVDLARVVPDVEGAWVERKRFAIAVHFRAADPGDEPRLADLVRGVADAHPELRMTGGKKILELRPDVEWDKGRALQWMTSTVSAAAVGSASFVAVYVGDDETDEDAFRAIATSGIGVVVGDEDRDTAAQYRLHDPDEVRQLLERLARMADSDE